MTKTAHNVQTSSLKATVISNCIGNLDNLKVTYEFSQQSYVCTVICTPKQSNKMAADRWFKKCMNCRFQSPDSCITCVNCLRDVIGDSTYAGLAYASYIDYRVYSHLQRELTHLPLYFKLLVGPFTVDPTVSSGISSVRDVCRSSTCGVRPSRTRPVS